MNRLKKYIVLDTETCGSIGYPLPYNISWNVCDKNGTVYRTRNYVVKEIFFGEPYRMKTCYYAEKLPQYYKAIKDGSIIVAKFTTIINRLLEDREYFKCDTISAHNARFDKRALENASDYLLHEVFSLPSITNIYDTMEMAKATICSLKSYQTFCTENNLLTPTGRIPSNAQALYCFLTNDPSFKEAHTALEDTLIEKEILKRCLASHKAMPKKIIAVY